MSGTLYGIGIGPGDPDLITVKARNLLARVPVIAYPAPEGGESLVRAIAAPHVPPDRTEIVIVTPMVVERFPAKEVYDRSADEIARHLRDGRDVAVLCEGDPFLYGSFMYLFERLSESFPSEVVPGVSSLAATAAVAGLPLVSRNEVLTILPAPLSEEDLTARIVTTDALAIMKVGRHLGKVRRVLDQLGLGEHAVYVERATMNQQRVMPLADVTDETAPYFSMILVRKPPTPLPSTLSHRVPDGIALVVLCTGGLATARRLHEILPGSRIHGLATRVPGVDVPFTDTIAHLRALFADGVPIVGICAAGILVRALAPLLSDKRSEPPVVAVTEDLSTAVPLLGGHRGANTIAKVIDEGTGAFAAITTAGDIRFGLALDEPPAGWRIAKPEAAKGVTAAILAGEPVALKVEAGNADWLTAADVLFVNTASRTILVTDRLVADPGQTLVLHPPVLALGVGCERGTTSEELIALAEDTLRSSGLSEAAVACVVSIDVKADEGAVHELASHLGVAARFFTAAELEAQAQRLANPSDVVFREVGCHGVAEGAALASVGDKGSLVVEKTRSARATCAVARAAADIDPAEVGRGRGTLTIVGIGPGDAQWRTPEATRALSRATDVVGYDLYLELIADTVAGKTLHVAPLGEEEARARTALDLASEGRAVALISSGDAGIYGLASLVFELLEREDRDDWNRLALTVAPGISALQAAAARIGAPSATTSAPSPCPIC